MGSAVVKPLTRRRGKIKKNKVAADPTKGNEGQNATSNCEPSLNRKVNSLPDAGKNLRQPFFDKPCKVDVVNNAQSNRQLCCMYPFFYGKTNSYDSDEELCQIQLVRKEIVSPSQTKNNKCNETHASDNPTNVTNPPLASTSTNVVLMSPSQSTHSDKCAKVNYVSRATNNISCPDVRSSQRSVEGKNNDSSVKQLVEPEDTVHEIELTEANDPEDQDVSRDARTPSPEYDELEDLKVINPNPSSTEPCAASPPLGGYVQYSETRIFPTSDINVSISNTQQPSPEGREEQRTEVGRMVLMNISLSDENMGSQYQGSGEPVSAQLDYSQDLDFFQNDTEPQLFEAQCEDLFSEKDNNSIKDDGCVLLCTKNPRSESSNVSFIIKAETDLPLECNENNAINSIHSFGADKTHPTISRSSRSSSTSLHNKGKLPRSDKSSGVLSLNHPHVEEVLAIGEEFVDDIDESFLQQSKVQSPYIDPGICLASPKEEDNGENLPLFSLKTITDISENRTIGSPRRTAGSPHSSLCSSKNSEISFGQHQSRPASGADSSARLNDDLLFQANIKKVKPFSRPSSAANEFRPQSSNQAMSHDNGRHGVGQNIMMCEVESGIASVDEVMPENSIITFREYSSKDLQHNFGAIQSQSASNTCKQSQSASNTCKQSQSASNTHRQSQSASNTCRQIQYVSNSRTNTPRATTTVSVDSKKVFSRPPSSKRSCSSSEQNQGRWRPNSYKQPANTLDSLQINSRPQSVHSRQSSYTSRPPSGFSNRLQCGLEVFADGDEKINSNVALTSSQTCSVCVDETAAVVGGGDTAAVVGGDDTAAVVGGDVTSLVLGGGQTPVCVGDDEPTLIDGCLDVLNVKKTNSGDSVGCKSHQTSSTLVVVMSATELIAMSPLDNGDSTESPKLWKASENISSFNHGCFPGLDTKSNPTTRSLSRSSMSSKTGAKDELEEPSQGNLATPKETVSPIQLSLSPGIDCQTTTTSGSKIRANNETGPLDEASSSAALATQTYCLSPDKIGNIRRQLYEEGLKPAEREGGVAFFIPVTEDGLLPQIDGATVAERLTKTKKASLNYEERMFLANINRQVQLSKKKEFAIRDIRNVKGATSSSDGSDRTKQSDDVDEFDASS